MRILILFCTLFTSALMSAQSPPVYAVKAESAQTLTYSMDLKEGIIMEDLSWAWSSQNACFVEPRVEYFRGNHVLFTTEIPAYSTMVIRVIPEDPSDNMSLYAYSGGGGALPPELYSCVSCEADFHQERPSRSRPNPDHTRSVELRAVTRPYPVTIGVAGATGVLEGKFSLEISVKRNR
ncbi:hypothetical protein [Lewinella sp. W8]|uniref:hypothetical protein n=1 Tax=Lewinella sp. W8 TaxID=2528208 RepID=UPI00106826F2|nr:hypothetical protein [Lewinella sp. W8]MTB51053.1 hypothetical protein [Lewinella sp. W8]